MHGSAGMGDGGRQVTTFLSSDHADDRRDLRKMKIPKTLLSMVLAIGIAHPATADHAHDVTKPLLGGIVGGMLGSTIGSGSGKRAATGIGAALGTMYGHEAAQREHSRRIQRDVRTPHALHAPTPRIRRREMTLNCRIADHRGTTPMYVCQENDVE